MMSSRVIVLDDEPDFGAFVGTVAQTCGFDVQVLSDPQAFKAAVFSFQPALILLDLSMPKADGIELLHFLAAANCRARIIIISGSIPQVVEAARRLGVERGLNIVGTLPKPVRRKTLVELFQDLTETLGPVTRDALVRAMDAQELFVEYQPQLDLKSGAVVGVEALVRWNHPDRGRTAPDQFIPLAEAWGLMDRLTTFVTQTAIRQQAAWKDSGLDVAVAVNVSSSNLLDAGFLDAFCETCRRVAVVENRITIEVTETAAMSQSLDVREALTRLRLKGFNLSIDDFGTGYSSLARLRELPFSELKIDRSFVKDCLVSKDAYAIVKSTVDLARNMDLQCVAEGVEDEETMHLLTAMGCTMAQGFVIAAPMPESAFPNWLSTR